MEHEIEKLLTEYQQKIDNCESLLACYATQIPYLRREKKDYSFERKDQAKLLTQKIAYQQAYADIDSLLDHIKPS